MSNRQPKNSYECKFVYKNNKWLDPKLCRNGDNCDFCHTKKEFDNHPINIKKAKTATPTANQVIFKVFSLF